MLVSVLGRTPGLFCTLIYGQCQDFQGGGSKYSVTPEYVCGETRKEEGKNSPIKG